MADTSGEKEDGSSGNRSVSRHRRRVAGLGSTPHEALAALMVLLPHDAPTPIVIWPYNQGDAFFTDAQQARLQELKNRRETLTEEEREEWEQLVEASFDATIARTQPRPYDAEN
jgi:hypothetical protein